MSDLEQSSVIKPSISNKMVALFSAYSGREQLLMLGAIIVAVYISGSMLTEKVSYAFHTQSEDIERLGKDLKALPFVLERYKKLQSRKKDIENEFKSLEMDEGLLSILESILKSKLGSSKFNIEPRKEMKFGNDYEQIPASVKFSVGDIRTLVAVLQEITEGKQKLLVTRLDVQKNRIGDALDIDMDVSSLRKKVG